MAIEQDAQVTRTQAAAPSSRTAAPRVDNSTLLRTALDQPITPQDRGRAESRLNAGRAASAEGTRSALGRSGGQTRDVTIGIGINNGYGYGYGGYGYPQPYPMPYPGPIYPGTPPYVPPPYYGGRIIPGYHRCNWIEALFKHDIRGPYGERYCRNSYGWRR